MDDDDDDDVEIEEVDSDEWDEDGEKLSWGLFSGRKWASPCLGDEGIPPTDCLFCDRSFQTAEKNVVHMSERHSFFLPDPEYLVIKKNAALFLHLLGQ